MSVLCVECRVMWWWHNDSLVFECRVTLDIAARCTRYNVELYSTRYFIVYFMLVFPGLPLLPIAVARGLRRGSMAARLLGLRVPIPPV